MLRTSMHYNVKMECHDFGALNLCCTRPTYREIVIASNRPRGLLRCGHPSFLPPFLPVCCVHSPRRCPQNGGHSARFIADHLAASQVASLPPSAYRNAPPASPIKALATRARRGQVQGGKLPICSMILCCKGLPGQ